MTAIQIINEVQRLLKLPLSTAVTQAHAAFLLSLVNIVQRTLMTDNIVWDELKIYGDFDTTDGSALYTVSGGSGQELDKVVSLQIDGYEPLVKLTDEQMKLYKLSYTEEGQPLFFRNYSRSGGDAVVELLPTPDDTYTLDGEATILPPKLTAASHEPMLDADAIVLGTLALARKDQGMPYADDMTIFMSKLSSCGSVSGSSNWGDVET